MLITQLILMGGLSNWVENVATSKNVRNCRKKINDAETVSVWQSLSYGICNKSSYCMAVCPLFSILKQFLIDAYRCLEPL
jgi:hypothetical protein